MADGSKRGRTTLQLEQAIDTAREGRVVWFVSHHCEASRAHLARCVELLQRLAVQTYSVNSPRREIGLIGGTLRFVELLDDGRGFLRPSLAPQLNRDRRFVMLNPNEAASGRIIFDHHAAYLLDRDERRRKAEDNAAALIMGGDQ